MTKKIKTEEIKGIFIATEDFEGSIASIFENLKKLEKLGIDAGYKNINVMMNCAYNGDDVYYYLTGEREETDAEYQRRMGQTTRRKEREKEKKKSLEENEREQFDRLRKKYG